MMNASPPLPAACDLVTPVDVATAIGAAVRSDGRPSDRDPCRYVSENGHKIEVTVDRPSSDDAVGAYRAVNPDAEEVGGFGEKAALRTLKDAGELIFVKGRIRFFVVVAGPSASRKALLILARAAAGRM